MARIRTIKPEFWKHEQLSALPESVHMLAAALLNYADDEGYFNANDKLVKAECCPLRESSVSIHDALMMLSDAGYLQVGYGADGRRYGRVVNFDLHQRVNRKTESKIKKIEIAWESSLSPHTQLTESSPPEGKGREGKGKDDAPTGAETKFAFESGRIRLNAKNLNQWKSAFLNLEVEAELLGLSKWAEEQGDNWFCAVSAALAKRNREIGIRQKQQSGPKPSLADRPFTEFIT